MTAGTTISHYRVTGELGRGGMGVVYKAEDTKLDRTVALKLLPPHTLVSEDDRARFYREARSAAALNHPNIAHVYEIDESPLSTDGGVPTEGGTSSGVASGLVETRPFIAMEYIEGESLAERIAKGPLPLKDAISIASQLAEGLKAAHDKDIVHRDMKSGNVMLTSAGVPKILDFGLAKTAASTKLTQMGSTLGTVAYMSPEQAKGEEVDRRSDIWSLGAIIYEMVTGRMPFAGDYEQAVVYGILNQDPEPLTALRTGVPMELERIVNKCLAKDRKLRYQHADDLATDLRAMELQSASRVEEPRTTTVTTSSPPVVAARPSWTGRLGAAAAILLFGALIGWLVARSSSPVSNSVPLHVSVDTGEEAGWKRYEPASRQMSLSPDGTRLIYIGVLENGMETLFLVDLTSPGPPRRLSHIELTSVSDPVFSPDGESVAFGSFDGIKLAALEGGTVKTVAQSASTPPGISWADSDHLVYSVGFSGGLRKVSVRGDDPVVLTEPDSTLREGGHIRGILLPGGRTVACVILGENPRLALIDTETGDRYTVAADGRYPQFVPPDILVYAEGQSLFAVQVDLSDYSLGRSRLVLDNVAGSAFFGVSQYTVSGNGSLAYLSGGNALDRRLLRISVDGSEDLISENGLGINYVSVSPSGEQIALAVTDAQGASDVALFDTDTGDLRTVTRGTGGFAPVWSFDGKSLFFSSTWGRADIYRIDGQSSFEPELLLSSDFDDQPGGISRDGRHLAFVRDTRGAAGVDVWILPMDDPEAAYPLAEGPSDEMQASISPDGTTVAYVSDVSGRREVYVTSIDGRSGRIKVSRTGETGGKLLWSRDGQYLYYVVDGTLMRSTSVNGGRRFTEPVEIMEADELKGRWIRGNWDLDPIREGIITLTQLEPSELRLIVNWDSDLKRRVVGD